MKVNVQTSEQKSIFACLKNPLHADRPVWVSTPENVLRRTEKLNSAMQSVAFIQLEQMRKGNKA